eukprot:COSAG01_NODE_8815_length_2651_cov_1.547414_2_plen_404_part_00
MTPEVKSNIHAYLTKHVPKARLARIVAEMSEAMESVCDTEALNDSVHQACAESIYKHTISQAGKDFLAKDGTDPWPPIKSRGLYPVDTLTAATINNRSNCCRQIYKRLGSELPIYHEGGYPWLTDVAAVVKATQETYKLRSTFELGSFAICLLCEALGLTELRSEYEKAYAALPELPETERAVLTKKQVAQIRRANDKKVKEAMEILSHTSVDAAQLGTVFDALTILTLYGSDAKHEPLRRDWVYVKFKGPHTDLSKANFITLGSTVTLTINVACKRKELSEPLIVDLTQTCPKLAMLLTALHPWAKKIQDSEEPWVFFLHSKRCEGSHMTAALFSQRMSGVWKRLDLPFEVPAGSRGCNGARHASVSENRVRRKLTSEERALEHEQAKRRISSTRMAETVYG